MPRYNHAGLLVCAFVACVALDKASAQELTFDEAQRLAETDQPQLAARRSATAAADEAAVAARQLPDPTLKLGLLNVPIEGANALSLDSEAMTMAMVGVIQKFPRAAKRELRGEVLHLSGRRSAQELLFLRLQMRRDAALAWLDAWNATRSLELIGRQQREMEIEIEARAIALKNNRASTMEVARARVALELVRDRTHAQQGELQAARARLARWIGARASAPLPELFPELPAPPDADELVQTLESHPLITTADADVHIAEAQARLAHQSVQPDWSMELAYGRRGQQFGDMVTLQFQIDLPFLQERRQDRSIASTLASAQQARELREDVLRELRASAKQLRARWESAEAQAVAFEQRVLPESRNVLQAATVSYRSGKAELADVLSARRELLDLELVALMRRVEAARLVVELDYFGMRGGRS